MSVVGVLFPLFFIFGCLVFLFFLMKKGKGFRLRVIDGRKTYMLLATYIVILFISAGVFVLNLFPTAATFDGGAEVDGILHAGDIQDELIYGDGSIASFDDYIGNKWEFDLETDHLNITEQMNDIYMPIIIEEKEEADGILEVTTYRTPTVLEGVDITDELDPVGISFSSDTLEVMVTYNNLKYVSFEPEFTTIQFSADSSIMTHSEDDKWIDEDDEWFDTGRIYLGDDLLYIRIPKGVKVEGSETLDIEYIK